MVVECPPSSARPSPRRGERWKTRSLSLKCGLGKGSPLGLDTSSFGPYLAPGTKVRHVVHYGEHDAPGEWEYGVVVHCWLNEQMQAYDCYVAFFGGSLPTGAPNERPYVLRYFSTSLEVIR